MQFSNYLYFWDWPIRFPLDECYCDENILPLTPAGISKLPGHFENEKFKKESLSKLCNTDIDCGKDTFSDFIDVCEQTLG